MLRHLSWKRAWIPRPPAPVNAPCPRSLCWRRAASQERGWFQTKPASRRREWCPRKPRSSRRPGPRDAAGPRPECTQPRRSAPGGQQGPGPEEPESSAGPLPRAGGLPPVTLQVRAPSTDAEVPSPTLASPTFSSALQRSSPRTTSFRMSPRRDSSESALTRSASVRLPVSSVKLGPKRGRYHWPYRGQSPSSVQARPTLSSSWLTWMSPASVTSSRRAGGPEPRGPSLRCKENLQLSRVVMSRLNQTPAELLPKLNNFLKERN